MNESKLSVRGLAHLFVVYVVWSTTYLAIKLGVGEGSGIPPFIFISGRIFFASVIIFAILLLKNRGTNKERILVTRREFFKLSATAILLWVCGNGFVVLAERTISTALAAIIVGTTPVWSTLFDSLLNKRKPSLLVAASILISFAGLALVFRGQLSHGLTFDIPGIALALGGTLSWALGMNIQKKFPLNLSSFTISAWQQGIAGLIVFGLSLAFAEGIPNPTPSALAAWIYLLVVGSIVAFTSFLTMVKLLPIPVATTYAYVNPVFAVLLGNAVLGERIDGWMIMGMGVVLVGIAGIYYKKH